MHAVTRRVARTIRRRGLFSAGDRIAVAVSGGSDSVALAWLMQELGVGHNWTPAGIIHVNHQLRGEESEADDAFCRALADRLGWPIEIVRVDVAAVARDRGRSIEVAAREVRYSFFAEAADRMNAGVVATGHTLDDQAETVLMRLLGGAGTRGLSGIRPRRDRVARPLIDCRRADLRAYLTDRDEPFREDSSNLDRAVPRNRIRRDLVPAIEAVAPAGLSALARLADLAADDEAALEQAAIETVPIVVLNSVRSEPSGALGSPRVSEPDGVQGPPSVQNVRSGAPSIQNAGAGVELSAPALSALPPALGRRVVRLVAAWVVPDARLSARHLEAVRLLAATERTIGHLDLPGLAVDRLRAVLTVEPPGAAPPARTAVEYPVEVPGRVDVPEAGVTITASCADGRAAENMAAAGSRVVLQGDAVAAPLIVRNRKAGDRFRPLGAPGRRKLQDVLVDRKVPRRERDRVPVVTDRNGHVVWIAGVAVAEAYRVTSPTAGVVVLEMRKNP
jgi:tRNA(Ile)-lysidine synthase